MTTVQVVIRVLNNEGRKVVEVENRSMDGRAALVHGVEEAVSSILGHAISLRLTSEESEPLPAAKKLRLKRKPTE